MRPGYLVRLFPLFVILILLTGSTKPPAPSAKEEAVPKSLGKMIMPIGAYYYPEHWDESEWEGDLKRMADLGLNLHTWENLHGL